ncbi:septal ring lytic transglycosylase RlpA family protein [Bartonella tamiae]|uniref:septal ring lytic transglycosylase RlpA family protein n=1 Tax=Bartonella tamiae TaxID=373638 RepID=UPI003CC909E2
MFALTACATHNQTQSETISSSDISAKEYGAIPVSKPFTQQKNAMKRGGGRALVGKPYKIKGTWYHPKEDESYAKVGRASWYGSKFHGKLTANGEIYDMNHLTAAHPTMPLPSYAKVTNLTNNSSLIVRVNDRGPFVKNRIIDLSQKAAKMLDYKDSGVAQVKVEYVGPAPIDGHDDAYLLASYERAEDSPDFVLAMADENKINALTEAEKATTALLTDASSDMPLLPDVGPILLQKPQETQQTVFIGSHYNKSEEQNMTSLIKPQTVSYSVGLDEKSIIIER